MKILALYEDMRSLKILARYENVGPFRKILAI
jgi:hypothetical protein